MSAIAKSLPAVKAPQSQLKDAGANAKAKPIGQLAMMIAADLKGGETKHDYQMTIIGQAVYQAFKGNTRDIPEAVAICHGKSAKSRAYLAGFQAIADDVKPVPYKGKFDAADNAAVREQVATAARHATLKFEEAYLLAVATIKAEAVDARLAKKAEKDAALSATISSEAGEASETSPAPAAAPDVEIDAGVLVDTIVDAIRAGALSAHEMTMLRAALATYDEASAASVADVAIANASAPALV